MTPRYHSDGLSPVHVCFEIFSKQICNVEALICHIYNKAVLEPRVSPAFAITYFCNHCNIRFENTSKYVDTLTFFPKTWTKGHWPLDDLWPHVCWGHKCDSIQGSLCPSPMTIHQCMWIQWSILQNTTYILHTTYILRTYYGHTTYRMSDHIVSYWTQFRRDKNIKTLTQPHFPGPRDADIFRTGTIFYWHLRVAPNAEGFSVERSG